MLNLEPLTLIAHLIPASQLNKLKDKDVPGVILRLEQKKTSWDWQIKTGNVGIVFSGRGSKQTACMYVCMCAHLCKCVHACVSGYAHICVHSFMHLCAFVQNTTFKSPGLSLWIKP